MQTTVDITQGVCELELNFLGGFSIKANGEPCELNAKRSKQVIMLIQYIAANRFISTSFEQFSDMLWGEKCEGNEVDDPHGALKNLVWRCRKVLKEALPAHFLDDLIIFTGNTYTFNNSISCVVDVEELENNYKILYSSKLDVKNRIYYLERATNLYGGDFLPGFSEVEWVVVRSSYYKRIYIECVNELLLIYINNELYDKAIALSEKAIKFEQYDENIHIAYIKSLAETNRIDKSISHYEYVVKIFYRDLGITVSKKLSNFYNEIQNVDKGVEININQIITEIDEAAQKKGGFYCSYEVLKNIYRVQYRTAKRSNQSIAIVIITIHGKLTIQNITTIMEKLKITVSDCLRTSDCFTRYSINQILMIIPNVDTENANKVNDRINKLYASFSKRYRISLTFTTVIKTQEPAPLERHDDLRPVHK